MTIHRPFVWLLAIGAALMLIGTAPAQAGDHDMALLPFGDWDFDPDFQWFSPVVDSEYGNEPLAANYGFFFTYDRMFMNIKRPNTSIARFAGDTVAWGNRFDLGFMTEEDHGWLFSATYFRVGDVNLEDINIMRFTSLELNKTWRCEPFYHGVYAEPFIGVRFMQYTDFQNGFTKNLIIGGQLGARIHKQIHHFVVAGEVRVFPSHNYEQFYTSNVQREEWLIGGEIRAEVSYLITRDIAVRFGWDTTFIGQGLARGNQPGIINHGETDEDTFMTGLAFGFVWKR